MNSTPLDSSMARADISASVNKYIPKLNNGDWKIRKEGIDAIELLLTQNNNKIKLDGLYDFISVLKSKINDPNKTLVKIFITFAGRFVEACGKDIKNHCKPILLSIISHLSDKQGIVRSEANTSIDKIAGILGKEQVINCMLGFICEDSVEMKVNILNYIFCNPDGFKKCD